MNENRLICRGKREDTGKCVEGYYVRLEGIDSPLHIIIDRAGQYNRVLPETVGECTGFLDSMGRLIFEGDIVSDNEGETYEVEYNAVDGGYYIGQRRNGITYKKQMKAFENNLMATLSVKYDINCNKEELQKALRYDRDSYCKGFKAGYEKRKSDYTAHWVISSDGYYPYCSECGAQPREMTKYCAECGRRMRGSDEKQEPTETAAEKTQAGVQESPEREEV